MGVHTYGEIPDSIPAKDTWVINRHFWRVFEELGFEYLNNEMEKAEEIYYPEIQYRMNESIFTSREVAKGNITDEEAASIITYLLIPPVLPVRSDLNYGANKLLWGISSDITFVVMDDMTQDLVFLLNGHLEDGIPVDWWMISKNDEIFDRRHRKRGFKLRDVYKNGKNFNKTGKFLLEILKDVRNERTPEFSQSHYTLALVWTSGLFNAVMERSNYEFLGNYWDGMNYKKIGMKDSQMIFYPNPTMLTTLAHGSRGNFECKFAGILTNDKVFLIEASKNVINFLKSNVPEFWQEGFVKYPEEFGIPTPKSSVSAITPKVKGGNPIGKYEYPVGEKFSAEDLNLTIDELFEGVYLNVDSHTDLKDIGPKSIICRRMGRNSTTLTGLDNVSEKKMNKISLE